MPKISVIVPVYKVEEYLSRCVDSILAQSFGDFDLILVDDGSPDNCGKICDEYAKKDKRIAVIHKDNGGLSDARNFGIEWALSNSQSEWITFIDSDDYVHNNYLEILYKAANQNNVNISCCGFKRFNTDLIPEEEIADFETDIGYAEALLEKKYPYDCFNTGVAWSRLYKKEIWTTLRFPVGKYHEDEYTVYKALYENGKIAVVNKQLYYYFQNENGIMKSKLSPKRMSDFLDSFVLQINYYFSNHFYNSGINRLKTYSVFYLKKFKTEYRKEKEYKDILKKHERNVKVIIKTYKKHAPKVFEEYRRFQIKNIIKKILRKIKSIFNK